MKNILNKLFNYQSLEKEEATGNFNKPCLRSLQSQSNGRVYDGIHDAQHYRR